MNELVTSAALAEQLGIPERTLGQWAYLGKGPAFIKVGHHRRYRKADIDAFVLANRHGGDMR